MKYLAIASLAAIAAASPALEARDGWENKPVVATTTWAPYPVTPKKPADTTWDEWHKAPKYTTTVVTAITTYCPEPTKIVHAGKTWTVTKATTLTITDCPCTVSVPVYIKTSTSCAYDAEATTWAGYPDMAKKPDAASTWAGYPDMAKKPDAASTWAGYPDTAKKPDAASTWAAVPAVDTKTPAASTWAGYTSPAVSSTGVWSPVATFKGAADKVNVGAGLAGVVGLAALLL